VILVYYFFDIVQSPNMFLLMLKSARRHIEKAFRSKSNQFNWFSVQNIANEMVALCFYCQTVVNCHWQRRCEW